MTAQSTRIDLKNIELLIDGKGDISIGRVGPIRCAAFAADEDRQLAALVHRPGESLQDLLLHLDAALDMPLSAIILFPVKRPNAATGSIHGWRNNITL